ncbi:MAG: NAD(P)-dependent oxidoreductase [Oligosphaeraceae bacterium]
MKGIFLSDHPREILRVFPEELRGRMASTLSFLSPEPLTGEELLSSPWREEVEVIFSTWGMPRLTSEQWGELPKLKAVFYAAGAVSAFARPLLERGVLLSSAWRANAIPVAEFALAQIILSLKHYFQDSAAFRSPRGFHQVPPGPGAYGETVGILGDGAVATHLEKLLEKTLAVQLRQVPTWQAQDPQYLLRVFQTSYVVTNHLPDLPELEHLLGEELFLAMRPGATFINTGRGAQVDEAGLARALEKRPDLTALLDVTWPEPPREDSPLYRLPNVRLSSHLAGSVGQETQRLGETAYQEYQRFCQGLPLEHGVSLGEVAPFEGKTRS